jgi:hypothetical protein
MSTAARTNYEMPDHGTGLIRALILALPVSLALWVVLFLFIKSVLHYFLPGA